MRDQTLTLLLQLVSKSLVVAEERAGATRHRMLQTIRQYAAEKLHDAGEENAARQRHFAYFLALAETAAPHLHGAQQLVWAERLEVEHDNLRAALAWAHDHGPVDGSSTDGADAELRLAGAMYWFWLLRDYQSEGRRWLEGALARTNGSVRTAARATALFASGHFAANQNHFVAARIRRRESVAIWRELGDKRGLALALSVGTSLGWATLMEDQLAEARGLIAEGVALWRELGDRWGLARALWDLGAVVWRDDPAAARSIAEECVALFREVGNRGGLAYALRALGYMARLEGDYSRAVALLEESLALGRELRSKDLSQDNCRTLDTFWTRRPATLIP